MIYKVDLSIAEDATEYEGQRIEASIHDDHKYGPILLLNTIRHDEQLDGPRDEILVTMPPISVSDLIRVLHAHGYAAMSVHASSAPYLPPVHPALANEETP